MIDVQLARTRQQLDRCLAMRRTVFTEELGVPPEVDVDGYDVLDGECLHFLVSDGGRDIGAIRCTPQEDGTVRLTDRRQLSEEELARVDRQFSRQGETEEDDR